MKVRHQNRYGKSLQILILLLTVPALLFAPAAGIAQADIRGGEQGVSFSQYAPQNSYSELWIGEMAKAGAVRSGPGANYKYIKSWWAGRRVLLYQAVGDAKGGAWYRVSETPEAPMYVHSSLIRKVAPVKFEGARFSGRWINVNVSQQVVTAYLGGVPVKVTLTSTGTKKHPTELGVWKISWRYPKKDMRGGSRAAGDYYYLKNVPYPQYFHK